MKRRVTLALPLMIVGACSSSSPIRLPDGEWGGRNIVMGGPRPARFSGTLNGPTLQAGAQVDTGAATAGTAEAAVRAVLDKQVEAWNRGDLEGFMAGYWNSPDLVFQSGATRTRGWQATLERYRQRYQAEGKEMGRLRFDELDMPPLSPDAAFVRGRWHLTMKDGSQKGGLFTLLLRRIGGEWKIVHDHTS